MSDLRNNIATAVIATTGNSGLGSGSPAFAKALGRQFPFQGTSAVIGQVAQNVFASDGCGLAFAAGQYWVRHACQSTSSGDVDTLWSAVPSTLPAGFTVNNKRNVFPRVTSVSHGAGVANGSHSATTAAHRPIFDGGLAGRPIRTATGVYLPLDSTNTYTYGPHNLGQAYSDIGAGELDRDTYTLCRSPGWRSYLIGASWHPDYFISPPATLLWVEHAVFLGATEVFRLRVNKADLVLNPVNGRYEKTYGPTDCSAIVAPAGQVPICTMTGDNSDGIAFVGNVNWNLRLAPRVDIPYPWTASTGNLVAPGGIVTGSIPGFP